MTLLRALAGWLARHALLFLLILAAMVAYGELRLDRAAKALSAADADLGKHVAALERRPVTVINAGQRASLQAIDDRLDKLNRRLADIERRKPDSFDLLRNPKEAIVANGKLKIDRIAINQERQFLHKLRRNVAPADTLRKQIAALDSAMERDRQRIAALPPPGHPRRYVLEGGVPIDLEDIWSGWIRTRTAQRKQAQAGLASLERQRPAVPMMDKAALRQPLAEVQAARQSLRSRQQSLIEREFRYWYGKFGIAEKLPAAALALLTIILTPLAIRALFYWVLAPLASLQAPVRLFEAAGPIPVPAERSTVSRAIALAAGQELLVRQGFVQSLSLTGSKATQWLLDSRFPLSSLMSGLYFLTRIRGDAGDSVTVSATRDPFAEIAVLRLPAGAVAVLQPRAIAGVLQPIGSPLQITSHWRLGTLNAWLTGQLRFLLFHGPADIILTGGRGVRIEAAQAGRSIGQDQLIGFSAGVAYRTGRTETFIPYLFGKEPLLKDRIAAGNGVLIAEEAPLARRGGAGRRAGLEGAADAVLKLFGI